MRVLVVSQYFWPENFRVNDLAAALAAKGHEVTVLTGVPNYPGGAALPEFAANPRGFDAMQGCSIVRVPMPVRGQGRLRLLVNYLGFALSASVIGAWKLRGRAFDVIFTFQVSPVTVGLPAVLLRRLKRAPHLFWVQDAWPETLAAMGALRSPRMLAAAGRLVSFIYRRCDHLLVTSEGLLPAVRARAPAGARVSWLPNWAQDDPMADGGADVPVLAPPGAEPGVFRIVFAGNLGEAQDFPAVLDAVALLAHRNDLHWYLVGDGSMAGWIRAEITRRGLAGSVTLPGRFPAHCMPGIYAQADALLVSLRAAPLFALTVPSKLQSCLAAGRPIAGMLDGEGALLIRRAQAGLACAAGDSAGLAAVVASLIALPGPARDAMGQAGRRHAAAMFDRDTLIARLEHWMLELCAPRRAVPDPEAGRP